MGELRLLCVATQHGDAESVSYLLHEARVPLPLEPSEGNPAVLAAHYGHVSLVRELLDSVPGPCVHRDLLNWMLVSACQQGHLEVVRMLVQGYHADAEDCAIHNEEFAVITGLPLYAAARAGNEDIASFLLQNGAGFSSYTLMDYPAFSRLLLEQRLLLCGRWSGLKLPWLELDWFMDVSSRISHLDLSCNSLSTLPSVVPWGLIQLQTLDLSNNLFKELPTAQSSQEIICSRLRQVNLSQNELTSLPSGLLHLTRVQKLSAVKNKLTSLFDIPNGTNWIGLRKLEELDVSDNCLTSLPSAVLHSFKSLTSLKVCRNRLTSFPDPWACPLKHCRASSNAIESLPNTISIFWRTQLQEVDFSDNVIKELPSYIFELEALVSLRLCKNQISTLPAPNKWKCSLLRTLDLSRNQLGNNPGIRELPAELGQLSNLWQLDIEDLNITNVPQDIRKEGPASVLSFLRAHLRKAEPCKLLKLLVIGPPRQGKDGPPGGVTDGQDLPFSPAERNISTATWELDRPNGVKASTDSVAFNVWDIGGPANMSTVNQCFFTDKALYVVIWNLALGEEAVANLQSWLLNIEARAPNSAVVVVGTHLDLIDTKFRTERVATLRAYILALSRSPSGARASGYPDITWKHLHEVSCKTQEGLDGLRRLIFQVACYMKDNSSSSASGHKLVGRLIPKSYLTLQQAVLGERGRRDAEDEVQYLTDAQLDLVIEQNPGSDIRDYEDLQTAISFLIETGTLLHFPDTSHGLCTLYFLCPVWLSECLERIIHLKSSRSTEEQYFQFLAKFEIALPVASDSYLLPHLLPPKPAMDIHGFRQETANTIQRLFKMSFVPAGFWERFIARMLISLTEMDLQSFEPKKNAKSERRRTTVIYNFAGTGSQQRNRCSTFRVRRSKTIYWREGLLVTFDGGYLSVESTDVNWKRKKSGGIKIICQSETRDFSAMAFVTDHVNSLIEQWFPALTASESDGTRLIEQYSPCPQCSSMSRQNQGPGSLGEPPTKGTAAGRRGGEGREKVGGRGEHFFNMEDCVIAAMDQDYIVCPQHPDQPVPLQELVPELFMTDFPSRLFLEKAQLECSEEESDILGQGGSGAVIYRACYRGQPVAIKRFHFKKCRQQTISSDTDTMMKHFQSMDACRSFSEFRQEASMLHSLQHPCIVALVGISIHPLCFALQLAPLGSLNTVLEDRHKGSRYMPLGHMLTFRAAYQIAAGLAYLHRKNIIFCDLKSDNILVWSLEVCDLVNIKLSDYGISRQSFHEGALGVEGTPGYQAPEIRPGIVYDEKVDMFSYGMVVYELLSGCRPALGQHQLQIAKKLSKGIRPALGSPEEVQFHCLHGLMIECWDTKPEKLFLSHLQGHSAVFWDGDKDDRSREVSIYSLKEMCPLSQPQKQLSCPAIVTCLFPVPARDQRPGNSPVVTCLFPVPARDQRPGNSPVVTCLFPVPARDQRPGNSPVVTCLFLVPARDQRPGNSPVVTCLFPRARQRPGNSPVVTCLFPVPARDQTQARVFMGMSDGLVAVYSLVDDMPVEGETYLCSHTLNTTMFGMEDSDPRQRPYPLWYSHGPGLLVINCRTPPGGVVWTPYDPPSSIQALASSLCLSGDEAVGTLDDHTNTLQLYHAATYQLCATYRCVRPVATPTPPGRVHCTATCRGYHGYDPDLDSKRKGLEEEEEECPNGEVTLIYSAEAGTQIIQHQDSRRTTAPVL
ncbi:leucine-rich repeat serine/threonine-protein kinase 1-like [Coregonus clupeaformis]|uniref:leucine-rich repeat serine/threonine-protein kinase 1-like n=1 Tax=Coregonus clupeaformis TaxID=59861 RepID=UPI001E1C65D3|nr:leucine-rich repeat serine/threonine-protein kinase 1-like [Coregonus clupeaformis]